MQILNTFAKNKGGGALIWVYMGAHHFYSLYILQIESLQPAHKTYMSDVCLPFGFQPAKQSTSCMYSF